MLGRKVVIIFCIKLQRHLVIMQYKYMYNLSDDEYRFQCFSYLIH